MRLHSFGQGDSSSFEDELGDGDVLYGYLRTAIGCVPRWNQALRLTHVLTPASTCTFAWATDSRAEQRTKFVFIRWVGNSISPMQRMHAMENKNRILDEAIKVQRCRCRGAVRWLPIAATKAAIALVLVGVPIVFPY